MEDEIKRINKRLEKLENIYDIINQLTISMEKLAIETKYLREDQNELVKRVNDLEKKPGKLVDTAVTSIITGIIGALIGAVMALIIK